MDNNEKFWILIWTIFGTTLVLLSLSIGYFSSEYTILTNNQEKILIDKGYVQKVVLAPDEYGRPTRQYVIWTKNGADSSTMVESVKESK